MHGEELGSYAYGMWTVVVFNVFVFFCVEYRMAVKEERDVEKQLGKVYEKYKKRVPAFIPRFGKGVAR